MKMIHGLYCLLLPVAVAFVQRSAQGNHTVIGTWRLVEFADLDKDGKWQQRFGETPRGYFVYDPTGHVHIQIMKAPPLAPFLKQTSPKVSRPQLSMPSLLTTPMSPTLEPTPCMKISMW